MKKQQKSMEKERKKARRKETEMERKRGMHNVR